jgi:hypothetical protein
MIQVQIEWHYGEEPEPARSYPIACALDNPGHGKQYYVTVAWFEDGVWGDPRHASDKLPQGECHPAILNPSVV